MPSQTYFSLTPAWLHGSSCAKIFAIRGVPVFCLLGITSSGRREVLNSTHPCLLCFLWITFVNFCGTFTSACCIMSCRWTPKWIYLLFKGLYSNEKIGPVCATLGTSAPFCGPDNYVASHLQSWKLPSFHPVVERNGLESQWHNKQASIQQRNEWLGR